MKTACFYSLLAPLLLAACSGASPEELATSQTQTRSQSTPTAVTRPIEIRAIAFVDPSATDVRQIIVTISRIDARLVNADSDDDAAWTTVSTQTSTVDLLSLQGGTFAAIGATALPANGVDRLRLQIDPFGKNFVETADGMVHGLVVPTGAILVEGDLHDLTPCATGSVTLQFRGDDGIVVKPRDDSPVWELRPVIWLDEVRVAVGCPKPSDG